MKGPVIFLISFVGVILVFLIVVKVANLKQHSLLTRTGVFRVVDKFLISFSVVGILITSFWDFNYLRFSKPIAHKDWETISMSDFKGLKMPKDNLDGMAEFAFISSSIQIKKFKDKIKIETLFHPCRSYVYNREVYSDRLLTHEMYHFHITEYCARLMRKDVQESLRNNTPIYVSDLRLKFLTEERQLKYQYDDETYHSYVLGKQLEWQEKVDSLLLSLQEYSDPFIYLKQ